MLYCIAMDEFASFAVMIFWGGQKKRQGSYKLLLLPIFQLLVAVRLRERLQLLNVSKDTKMRTNRNSEIHNANSPLNFHVFLECHHHHPLHELSENFREFDVKLISFYFTFPPHSTYLSSIA